MNYQKDYNRNKEKILQSFQELIEKEEAPLLVLGFELAQIGFVNARSQDDYIQFIWRTEEQTLKVCFWIPFWKNYEIDENFMVTLTLKNNIDKNHPELSKAFEFKKLIGGDIRTKMGSLINYIVKLINS